jgi:hypothetical protein
MGRSKVGRPLLKYRKKKKTINVHGARESSQEWEVVSSNI